MRAKRRPSGQSAFHALGFKPELVEKLEKKSALMVELQGFVKRHGLTQNKAAVLLEVSQPRVSDLMNGRISQFSLDELVRLCERAGLAVTVRAKPNSQREQSIVGRLFAALDAGVEYVYQTAGAMSQASRRSFPGMAGKSHAMKAGGKGSGNRHVKSGATRHRSGKRSSPSLARKG